MGFPSHVKIVEVSPRDGLQNESQAIPTDIKIQFINQLSETGLSVIETTSFVSPKWIPQLADHKEVYQHIEKKPGVHYPVLVPNQKGFTEALLVNVKEIAVFTTPSETFCQRNTNCTVSESLEKIREICLRAKEENIAVRGYLSCVLGCPYEGFMEPKRVTALAEQLIEMGCYEISLGDTIGVGTAGSTQKLLNEVLSKISEKKLAVHFHDTYGQALVNIYVALQYGIAVIDSSVAGLGGCPYAKGASGNVATEDVLYMLQGLGIETGVNIEKIIQTGRFISSFLGSGVKSKVNQAYPFRV